MADSEKKEAKSKKAEVLETLYYIAMTVVLIISGILCWCKVTDRSIYLFGTLLSCYTFGFLLAGTVFTVRSVNIFRSSGKKFGIKLFLNGMAAAVTVVCFVNSFADDVRYSGTKDILKLSDKSNVMLWETEITDDDGNVTGVRIDVYSLGNHFARKLGEIDESLFSVRCVETDSYKYFISDDGRKITIECNYGTYGDGVYALDPAADTGSLTYYFEVK